MANRTRGVDLARRARVAETHWTRLRGLLGRRRLRPGEGLVLTPSRGVHTWGLHYTLDVVFTNAVGRVVALYPDLRPFSRTRIHREAVQAIELPAGTIRRTGTRENDLVAVLAPGSVLSAAAGEEELR